MYKLFLLEDNNSLGESLEQRLSKEGYSVLWRRSCSEARQLLKSFSPDLALLDVALSDGSGFDIAREILSPNRIPIIFLSAFSTAEYRLEGYDIGAVDYIPKPFHLRELLHRIDRALKVPASGALVKSGGISLDVDALTLSNEVGAKIHLSKRDFELLHELIKTSPRVWTRDEIIQKIWGADSSGTARGVDNAIVRLRDALGDRKDLIRSVRGVGYQWVVE